MSSVVPPLLIRRVLHLLWPPVALFLALILGLLALPMLFFAPWLHRDRLLRLTRIAVACLALDVGIVVGCWWLWCRQPPWRRDPETWRAAHTALLDRRLRTFMGVAERTVGLQVRTDAPSAVEQTSAPLLVLARHIGAGDSLIVAHLVVSHLGRTPRVMLKRFLLWDPATDLVLNRLGCYFLPPRRTSVAERQRLLETFARSLGSNDALILFPEGGNWSKRRHADALQWAAEHGTPQLREWVADHPRVLPPRAKGTQQVLQENPGLIPMVVAHFGLDHTGSPRQVWAGMPLSRPVDVVGRIVPRPQANDLATVERWLQDYWSRIDRWVERHGAAPAPDPSTDQA